MRKIFMVGASAAASVLLMTGCNKQVIDLTYEYSQAQIKMPDGTVIEGKVDSWKLILIVNAMPYSNSSAALYSPAGSLGSPLPCTATKFIAGTVMICGFFGGR